MKTAKILGFLGVMGVMLGLAGTLALPSEARGQMIAIPFAGTNDLTGPPWWQTTLTNATGIAPYQAWQAVNTNFATLQGEFDYAMGTGIPAMISPVQGFVVGVSNNVTAATNALNSAIVARGYLTGNQTVTVSGDGTGSGTTAVSLVITNIQPPGGGSTGQPLTKTATGVGFGSIAASSVTGLTDADTNAVLQSGTFIAATTNWIYVSGATTNILPWVLTNYAGCTYYATSGVPTVLWSTDSGTTWNSGAESLVTNVAVKLAFFAGAAWGMSNPPVALNGDIGVTNIVVYGLSRWDLYGRTNQTVGQRLQVGTPLYPPDAVPKSYVDALAGQVGQLNASQDGQLNAYSLHLDSAWNLYSASSNNALTATFLGGYSWGVTYPVPTVVTNALTVTTANRTNVTVKVATNGLSSVPVLKLTHFLKPLNWNYLSTTPTNSGTNWVFNFIAPYTDQGYVAPVLPSTNPPALQVAGVLDLMPFAAPGTNLGALRIWNSNNAALYARGTNGADKLLLSFP